MAGGGPGGREVGRLSVRVLPDTRRFGISLQRYLDRVERRSEVRVQVVPDPDIREFRQRLQRRLELLHNRTRVSVKVDPDFTGFRTKLRDGTAAEPTVRVKLEVTEAEIQRLRRRLANLRPPISIPARLDVDDSALTRLRTSIGGAGGAASAASSALGGLRTALLALGAASTSIPTLAATGKAIAEMGPAAAVAAPALLSVATAGGAVAIGMQGVPAALQGSTEALDELAPSARHTVTAIRSLAPEWSRLQSSVQATLFEGMGDQISSVAGRALPALERHLTASADAVNAMGREILLTGEKLGDNGTFGAALDGANEGLSELSKTPARVLEAFTILAAGAAPAWKRVAGAVDRGMGSLNKRLARGLESRGLERSIDRALDRIRSLGPPLADIGRVFQNVFGPAADAGAGALSTIAGALDALAKATGSAAAQSALSELFRTLNALGGTVTGALSSALGALMPLLDTLTSSIGPALRSLLDQVGPVVKAVISAVGDALGPAIVTLSSALAGLAPVAGRVAVAVGGSLVQALGAAGPLVDDLARVLLSVLLPTLQRLPEIVGPFIDSFDALVPVVTEVWSQVAEQLGPALADLGALLAELLVEVAPLAAAFSQGLAGALTFLMPVVSGVISAVRVLANVLVKLLRYNIVQFVMPILRSLAALLRGDFRAAWDQVKQYLSNVARHFVNIWNGIRSTTSGAVRAVAGFFTWMGSQIWGDIKRIGGNIRDAWNASMRWMGDRIRSGVQAAINAFRGMRSSVRGIFSGAGTWLVSAGKQVVQGFVRGIKSAIGSVKSTLSGITKMIPKVKGPEHVDKRLLTPAGRYVMEGFLRGLRAGIPDVRRALLGVTSDIPAMVGATAMIDAGAVPEISSGLRPGDRIALTIDGQTTLDAVIQRGAQSTIARSLTGPASRGRVR